MTTEEFFRPVLNALWFAPIIVAPLIIAGLGKFMSVKEAVKACFICYAAFIVIAILVGLLDIVISAIFD